MNTVFHTFRNGWVLATHLLLALVVTACASGGKIYTNEDPGADFRAFKTFRFENQLGTDRQDGTKTVISQQLMAATRQQMEQRGFRFSEDSSDLVLNFFLNTEEKTQVRQVPRPGPGFYDPYFDYRVGSYDTWGGYETRVTQFTEGSLHIDFVDNKRDQLVFEGVAIGRLTKKDMENIDATLSSAVTDVFTKFPHTATP